MVRFRALFTIRQAFDASQDCGHSGLLANLSKDDRCSSMLSLRSVSPILRKEDGLSILVPG